MKRDYIALWSLLAVAFVLFMCLSMHDDIKIGPFELKTPRLSNSDDEALSSQPDTLAVDSVVEAKPSRVHLDSNPKSVLIIGDSMIEGLAPRLSSYCKASDDSLYAVIWYSSTTELYGDTHLISDYIAKVHPDYIFISLGGNELFVNDVIKKREPYVKAILQEIGDIPFLWIGPPNWKPDTGINRLIKSTVPEGCFFLSDGMRFERKRDGAHPTSLSAAAWMDSIINWMPANAHFVLPLSEPEVKTIRPHKLFLHQPGPITSRP